MEAWSVNVLLNQDVIDNHMNSETLTTHHNWATFTQEQLQYTFEELVLFC